jgi:hypothetical protein
MIAIAGPRQAGKTTRLVALARTMHHEHMDEALIVTPFPLMRRDIMQRLAADERFAFVGPDGPRRAVTNVVAVHSPDELADLRDRLRGRKPLTIYIDDLDTLLRGLFTPHRVEVVTLTGHAVSLSIPEGLHP